MSLSRLGLVAPVEGRLTDGLFGWEGCDGLTDGCTGRLDGCSLVDEPGNCFGLASKPSAFFQFPLSLVCQFPC
jgi:hypothetical protein